MLIYAAQLLKPADVTASNTAVGASSSHDRSAAEQSWDNEGGCAFVTTATKLVPANIRPHVSTEIYDLTTQLQAMTERLNEDFSNARVGARHQTYEHRSRMVRQLKGRLDKALLTAAAAAGSHSEG